MHGDFLTVTVWQDLYSTISLAKIDINKWLVLTPSVEAKQSYAIIHEVQLND
jgi:hypothetical protein